MMSFWIGTGIDFHRLESGIPFWIGGLEIPHEKGAIGHSDADVLLHAICDALLGALSLGDIGTHFPDTDPAYKGIDSKVLLKRCHDLICEKGYSLINIDSSICLQRPKLRPYIAGMQAVIADILDLDPGAVSIKATTTEQLGFVGREEGVMAQATVLMQQRSNC